MGEFDVSNQNEPYPYVERRVKNVVSHPSFDPKTFEYDLALMRFTEPIKFERNVIPVCIPSGNDSYVDRTATVIGWGRLYEGEFNTNWYAMNCTKYIDTNLRSSCQKIRWSST